MNTDRRGSVFIGGFILCSFTQTKFEMIGSHHRSHEVAGLPACPLQPLVRLRYSATARYHFRSSTAAPLLPRRTSKYGFGENLGDVAHLNLLLRAFGLDAVGHHGHAKGAGGCDRFGIERQGFFRAFDIDALPGSFFHEHPGPAGPAAKAFVSRTSHL